MRPPADTDPEIWELQLERWRAMTPEAKLAEALRLSRDMVAAVEGEMRQRWPDAAPEEVRYAVVRHFHGAELADAAVSRPSWWQDPG